MSYIDAGGTQSSLYAQREILGNQPPSPLCASVFSKQQTLWWLTETVVGENALDLNPSTVYPSGTKMLKGRRERQTIKSIVNKYMMQDTRWHAAEKKQIRTPGVLTVVAAGPLKEGSGRKPRGLGDGSAKPWKGSGWARWILWEEPPWEEGEGCLKAQRSELMEMLLMTRRSRG